MSRARPLPPPLNARALMHLARVQPILPFSPSDTWTWEMPCLKSGLQRAPLDLRRKTEPQPMQERPRLHRPRDNKPENLHLQEPRHPRMGKHEGACAHPVNVNASGQPPLMFRRTRSGANRPYPPTDTNLSLQGLRAGDGIRMPNDQMLALFLRPPRCTEPPAPTLSPGCAGWPREMPAEGTPCVLHQQRALDAR